MSEFTEKGLDYQARKDGTNLCAFIRALIVWTPLILAAHVLVYALAGFVLMAVPLALLGVVGYLIALGVVGAIVLAIWGLIKWVNYRDDKRWRARQSISQEELPSPADDQPSFTEVAWKWAVAQKQKVCPLISFTNIEQGAK